MSSSETPARGAGRKQRGFPADRVICETRCVFNLLAGTRKKMETINHKKGSESNQLITSVSHTINPCVHIQLVQVILNGRLNDGFGHFTIIVTRLNGLQMIGKALYTRDIVLQVPAV